MNSDEDSLTAHDNAYDNAYDTDDNVHDVYYAVPKEMDVDDRDPSGARMGLGLIRTSPT